MNLHLKRPLAFIDLETTGINVVTDRIIEIGIHRVNPSGGEDSKVWRVNPGMPIPYVVTLVHGIKDEDVKDSPLFSALAKEIYSFIAECDIAGYNSNKFDVPMLLEEFTRAGVNFDLSTRKLIDVQNIFHKMEKRTLAAAFKFYCDKDLAGAHGAAADSHATYEVLKAQLDKYPDLKNDMDALAEFSSMNKNVDLSGRIVFNEHGVEVFNFGKHKGKAVKEIFTKDQSYYDWMMKGEFATDTKNVITRLRLRDFNKV
jgi:DNA polymerase-3 subunit epsilon